MNFFVFIASIIFFLSLLSAGGAYAYLVYVRNDQEKIKENLDKNIKSFEPKTIEEYVRLSSRMSTARILLSKHVALSNVFDFLSDDTLKTIRFTDFKYAFGTDGKVSLDMNGQAKNYNSVAYQSEVFGKKRELKNLLFSDLDLDEKGNVVFKLSTDVDPAFTYYSTTLDKRKKDIFSNNLPTTSTTTNNAGPLDARTGTTTP